MSTRVRLNENNTGIIYVTNSGDEVEIPIPNIDVSALDDSDSSYHEYSETSEIPGSEHVSDNSIIEENFLEEPAPTFGYWNQDQPVSDGDVSFALPVGYVTHYVVEGPNGETIIVNVTNDGQHALDPGIVVRELYQGSDGKSYIDDTGVGTGLLGGLNEELADGLWQGNADRIGRESVYEDVNGTPPPPSNDELLPIDRGGLPGWVQGILDDFGWAENNTSPLVLDLDGDGIELAAFNGTGSVYWDIDVDGMGEKSGWISGGDGLLAIDLNSDGVINDHSELFGNQTGSANGFIALAAYDSNSDNSITSADTQFDDLLVWVDTNADGVSQAAELHSLDDLGITSINLGYTNVNYQISGNDILQESTFTINGNTRTIVDAWFAYDDTNTVSQQDYTLDPRVLFLPSVRGFGNIPDLHIAMSQDETLLDMVAEIATSNVDTIMSSTFDVQGKMEAILYRWAGVDGVSPSSRGSNIDARQLEFLEEFVGREWVFGSSNLNPGGAQANALKDAFFSAFTEFTSQILLQTDAKSIFPENASYDLVSGETENLVIDNLWFSDNYSSIYSSDNENDSYVYNLGNGNDTIYDTGGDDDVIVYGSAVDASDIRLEKSGNHLYLRNDSDNSYIKIDDHFDSGNHAVEQMVFADGTRVDLLNNLTFKGTSSSNYLYGTDNADTLIGIEGNDRLYGLAGDDTYVYGLGDGNEIIYETQGSDQIVFESDISVSDIRLEKSGNHLYLRNDSDNSYIKIDDHFATIGEAVEQMVFDDGTTVDLLNNLSFTGSSNNDYLYGTDNSDMLSGVGGNDNLYGLAGDDTYVYNLGDGNDKIYDTQGNDQIVYGSGISASDIRLEKSGNHLYLRNDSDNSHIFIDDHFQSSNDAIEQMVFADGTTVDLLNNLSFTGSSSNDYLYGTDNSDTLSGVGGNDNLYGLAGDDTYVYNLGDGNDTISDTQGNDQIIYGSGISVSDIRLEKSSNNLYLRNDSDNSYIKIDDHFATSGEAVEQMVFADGTTVDLVNNLTFTGTASNDYIYGTNNAETIKGVDGDDNLYGYDGNDVLYGGDGLDKLYGGTGADTFVFEGNSTFNDVDIIKDYNASENDVIDISDLLSAYDPLNDSIADFITMTEVSGDTIISVDQDGSGSTHTAQQVVNVDNTTGLDINDMITNNELLVA